MKRTTGRHHMALPLGTAVAALLFMRSAAAFDTVSTEFAVGNKTHMARTGLQWNWDQQWLASKDMHVSGYWDATIAQWRGNRHHGLSRARQDITDIGLTPVFRWQPDSGHGLFAEAGIGLHVLSRLYDNNGRKFSTAFQFGDHVGVGYRWPNGTELSIKIQHYSNGSIKRPNPGVNFAVVKLGYSF